MKINADNLGSNFLVTIGPRCPFCGKAWSDSGPCGDIPPEDAYPRAWKDRFHDGFQRRQEARRLP